MLVVFDQSQQLLQVFLFQFAIKVRRDVVVVIDLAGDVADDCDTYSTDSLIDLHPYLDVIFPVSYRDSHQRRQSSRAADVPVPDYGSDSVSPRTFAHEYYEYLYTLHAVPILLLCAYLLSKYHP